MQTSLLDYLENSALKFPQKIAFEDEKRALSFKELKQEAKIISDSIISKIGFKNNQAILIFLDKSVEVITSMLGILYSGNFYTPTNPSFPEAKIKDIMEVLEPGLIISDNQNIEKLLAYGILKDKIINLDNLDFNLENPKTNEKSIIDTDLAYVFFTSGSTGKPKGVTLTHKNVINYIEAVSEVFPYDENTISANQAAFYFDLSTHEIYLSLKKSSKLVIVPQMLFTYPAKLIEFLDYKDINTLYWVPSAFLNIINFDVLEDKKLEKIVNLGFLGEVVPIKNLNYLKSKMPNLKFICDTYGPTETTVAVSYYEVKRDFNDDENLPLGKPFKNTRLFILDEENKLIKSPNIKGELCVAGSSLSPGYYKNPSKTKEVFIQNPSHNDYKEIIYRTGDLASYNENNELIFHGRIDNQIKHLGYRIELGEIETLALSLDFVTNAVSLYDTNKHQIILLYSSNDENKNDRALRLELLKLMPKYMVPTIYYSLKNFPLNANSKIDRKKLKDEYLKA